MEINIQKLIQDAFEADFQKWLEENPESEEKSQERLSKIMEALKANEEEGK